MNRTEKLGLHIKNDAERLEGDGARVETVVTCVDIMQDMADVDLTARMPKSRPRGRDGKETKRRLGIDPFAAPSQPSWSRIQLTWRAR